MMDKTTERIIERKDMTNTEKEQKDDKEKKTGCDKSQKKVEGMAERIIERKKVTNTEE
jgi:hypothetical protein